MDRKHFLDSQLWLLRLSKEALDELQTDFKFHSLLTNAYCCFQIDKRIVYLSTGASSSHDSTQLQLEVLIAVDKDLERSAIARHTSAPGLYFILDGVYYIVNHTHICNISVPQISTNGEEPPSAFLGWQGVQMRWWLGPDIAANLAVQKLSHAIKTMNDVLLPWCLSHKCITSARFNRRLDVGVSRSNGDGNGDGDGHGDGAKATRLDRSSSSGSNSRLAANAELTGNTALRGRSSSSSSGTVPVPVHDHDHGSVPATNSNNNNNNNNNNSGININSNSNPMQIDLTSTSLSHRFESWMTFMEITNELLAKVVTPAFICDSFLSAKMTPDSSHRSGSVPYKHQNLDQILNLDTDHVLSSSIIQPSSFSGGDVEDEQFLIRPRKKARNSVTGASITMSTSTNVSEKKEKREKDDVVCDEVEESTGHNGAARHFLRGVMSLEEAASAEEILEGLRRKKESALQTLIKDFYSYSNPNALQGNDVAVRTSTSTSSAEHSLDKASYDRRLILQMTALLDDMNSLAEDAALLRAMPRSQDL